VAVYPEVVRLCHAAAARAGDIGIAIGSGSDAAQN
jgi:hypothetical protein